LKIAMPNCLLRTQTRGLLSHRLLRSQLNLSVKGPPIEGLQLGNLATWQFVTWQLATSTPYRPLVGIPALWIGHPCGKAEAAEELKSTGCHYL
jgi:hypothetical protein